MYHTYILRNAQDKLYIGQTSDLDKRLQRHNSGKSVYTRQRGPWNLIYKKAFETRAQAMCFEKYLKSIKDPLYIREHIISS